MSQEESVPLDLDVVKRAAKPLLDSLPFPVLSIDSDHSVRYRNAQAERAYGSRAGTCHELMHGYSQPCDQHGEPCPMAEALRRQSPTTVCHAHVTGEHSITLHKVIAVPLEGGGILECHIDLDDLVSEDDLTHVSSRGFFLRIVARELMLLERLEAPFAFLVIDLDGFKAINDLYGHDIGDEVLRQTADVLQRDLRRSDAIGRWGGDEFVLFLPSLGPGDAAAVAERKAASIRQLIVPSDGGQVRPRASFGLFCSDRTYDLMTAFRAADRALYQAKRKGGDRVIQVLGEP